MRKSTAGSAESSISVGKKKRKEEKAAAAAEQRRSLAHARSFLPLSLEKFITGVLFLYL